MAKKVMLVFGTRPEAIKICPLVKEFQKHPDEFETIVCVTGQHREMLDQVLTIFDVKPNYDLNIMKQGQDLYDVTARVLTGMRDVFNECKPDVVLVHGDTTTSTAAALAAFYQQIPVGHVEAGLRTHNIYSPWLKLWILCCLHSRMARTEIFSFRKPRLAPSRLRLRLYVNSSSISLPVT